MLTVLSLTIPLANAKMPNHKRFLIKCGIGSLTISSDDPNLIRLFSSRCHDGTLTIQQAVYSIDNVEAGMSWTCRARLKQMILSAVASMNRSGRNTETRSGSIRSE